MPYANPIKNREYKREYYKMRWRTDAAYRQRVRELAKPKQYGRWLKSMYGIDLEEYDRLKVLQKGLCGICGREGQKLVVDHDGVTGRVRGLLCTRCNTNLGWHETVGWPKIDSYLSKRTEIRYAALGSAKRINDGLTRWQRYRLKNLDGYRKAKREYARSPAQREKRRTYAQLYSKRVKATRLAMVNFKNIPIRLYA